MRKLKYFIFALLLLNLPMLALAERSENWDCYIKDANNLVWKAQSSYKRQSVNKVKDLCKKASQNPLSCTVKQVQCESIFKGYAFAPLWQCTGIDRIGAGFRGSKSQNRDTAAINARSRCVLESTLPFTCYVNTITCNNLNQGL